MKTYYKKIKRLVINRLLNPIIFRSEKNEIIAKKYILNKPVFKYKQLWVNGFNIDKKIIHIKKQEQLYEYVCGWLSFDRNIIYLCNSNIIVDSSMFNSEFELIVTNSEWIVVNIFENVKPEDVTKFDFHNDNKIPYFWIAKPGFCLFNKITKKSKLSTNYRSSDIDYFEIN